MSLIKMITIEELNNALDALTKIYDSARIIRPLRKKIIKLTEGLLTETQHNCYDFWPVGKVCSNCISMRAFNEKDIFFKLEWVNNKIYMVIAVPVQDTAEVFILELLKDITNSITVEPPEAIHNNPLLKILYEFEQQQIKDSLTGLFNRRFIDERLPSDILNCSMDSRPLAVIFADIDHFKLVNDTYGHVAGDHVLKGIAVLLQKSMDHRDGWVARYGGEEFLISLKNESLDSVAEFAERLRKEIENSEFNYDAKSIKITLSFGVCSLYKAWNIKVEELIDCADKNLYAAKSSGRNKIVASEL